MLGGTSITYAAGDAFDLVFDAHTVGAGGSIIMGQSSTIATNGGNIYMGGGALDGSGHPTGYALGTIAAGVDGIQINSGSINAGGGNITMFGQGGT